MNRVGDCNYRIVSAIRLLKERRIALGITQEQVACRIGLHRPAWSEIEALRQHLTAEQLVEVAEYLGIPIEELFSE